MFRPRISICLLAHNSEKFIEDAIKSVLAQTFSDWEMLISDDASSDGTADIARSFLGDRRIRYVYHEENLKQAGNWAYAIQNTYAPYVATLHADDVWETHALAAFSDVFAENENLDLAWANWDYYDAYLQEKKRTAPVTKAIQMRGYDGVEWLVYHNHALPSATAFSRKVWTQAGGPDHRYGMLCDREFFLRIASLARYCRALPVVITRYRQHEATITHDFSITGKLQKEMMLLADNASQTFRFCSQEGDRLSKGLRSELGKELFLAGVKATLSSQSTQAKIWLKKGLQLAGWNLIEIEMAKSLCRTAWYAAGK